MAENVLLITGASRGIGRATALGAGRRGWAVVVNYLHNEVAAQEWFRPWRRYWARGGQWTPQPS
jgi:NAD(P)-dependent dehydrogenase (short-subunit alcohol dehydrogenase family)